MKRQTVLLLISILASSHAAAGRSAVFAPQVAIDSLSVALHRFNSDVGGFPTTREGLQALVQCPKSVTPEVWHGPYMIRGKVPLDSRKNRYVYRCPGIHLPGSFDLYSLGEDGETLTAGDDPDDINNWNSEKPWLTYYGRRSVERHRLRCVKIGALLAAGLLAIVLFPRRILRRKRRIHLTGA